MMTLGEELAEWNSVYPRINVNEVQFIVEEEQVSVSAFGDLPLY